MPTAFASGKRAIAQCDRCGFRTKLKELRPLTIKTKQVNILVCRECWEPDHPQLQLGLYPVNDPQALRNPRPDLSYPQSRALIDPILIGAGSSVAIGELSLVFPDQIVTEDDQNLITENSGNIVTEGLSSVIV